MTSENYEPFGTTKKDLISVDMTVPSLLFLEF